MAHIEQLEFFNRVFKSFPEVFLNASSKVIDIGSLDINGGPHELLDLDYLGTDIGEGRNVNLVCPSQELGFATGNFDAAISSECFEHNPFWRESLGQMARLTKLGGIVVWSCAGIGRAIHGTSTSKDSGVSAPFVANSSNYYQNLDARTAEKAINHIGWYSHYVFLENLISNDTYFVGIRHGASPLRHNQFAILKNELEQSYGDATSLKIRRIGYKIGCRKTVEKYFDLRRFVIVVFTADQKITRAKKRIRKQI